MPIESDGSQPAWERRFDVQASLSAVSRFNLCEVSSWGLDYLRDSKGRAVWAVSRRSVSRDGGYGLYDFEWAAVCCLRSVNSVVGVLVWDRSCRHWVSFNLASDNRTFARRSEYHDGTRITSDWKERKWPIVWFDAKSGIVVK